ncbi:MAG TPA: hypothetical protein VL120_17275 [Solirubrobacteraceae bacterium]|nr:hypothetical protein [Solirubrobacteraceae bacterium]
MAKWLDRLIDRQRATAPQSDPRRRPPSIAEQRAWLVRPLEFGGGAEPGTELTIAARADVRMGHSCLVVAGTNAIAAGVVLGESAGKKGTRAVRTVLVTHGFEAPFQIDRSLGNARAVPATLAELRASRDTAGDGWDFVQEASEALDIEGRTLSPKTLEEHAEEFLVEVLKAKGLRVGRQVRLPGTEDPDVLRLRPLRADVVVTWSERAKQHALIIEGEWTQPGGAQSAAQAYEYARRLQDPEASAPAGFEDFRFRDAVVHAVVVANRCPPTCLTAETLRVPRLTYAQFVARVGHDQLGELTPVGGL